MRARLTARGRRLPARRPSTCPPASRSPSAAAGTTPSSSATSWRRRLHAKIYFEDGRWHVRDFGLNGTRVDGAAGQRRRRAGRRAARSRSARWCCGSSLEPKPAAAAPVDGRRRPTTPMPAAGRRTSPHNAHQGPRGSRPTATAARRPAAGRDRQAAPGGRADGPVQVHDRGGRDQDPARPDRAAPCGPSSTRPPPSSPATSASTRTTRRRRS